MIPKEKPRMNWSTGIIDWHLPENLEKTTFLAVGDILLAGYSLDSTSEGEDPLFSNMQRIFKSADVAIGNLENPLSERGAPIRKYGPNFHASPKMAKILHEAGFTVLGVANNHARDYGDLAFVDTLDHLKREGILPVGGGRDKLSALQPVKIRKRNTSLGILAFTYRQESVADKKRPGAADLDDPKCYDALKTLSAEVDLAIVYLHIDGEFSNYPAPHRINAARRFVDFGAEMVIGHHPHVPQGIEIYKGKLIAYSLGNFIFQTQKESPMTSLGYALKAGLTQKGAASVGIIPYRLTDFREQSKVLSRPTLLSGADHQNAMLHLKHISSGLGNTDMVRLNWEQVASRDSIAISQYIMRSILTGGGYSAWSSQKVLLRHRYSALLKRLLTGKMPEDMRRLLVERTHSQGQNGRRMDNAS